MNFEEEIRSILIPTLGFRKSAACGAEIRHLVTELNGEETVLAGFAHGKPYIPDRLFILTDQHMYALRRKSERVYVETIPLDDITEVTIATIEDDTEFSFLYNNEVYYALLTDKKKAVKLIKAIDGVLPIAVVSSPADNPEAPAVKKEGPVKFNNKQSEMIKRSRPRAKTDLKIVSGREELGYQSKYVEMVQRHPGEVSFRTGFKEHPDIFLLHEYERTEIIALDCANESRAAFWGNFYGGNIEALNSVLKNQMGKDKFTVSLFLERKDDGHPMMLIVKCREKTMQSLAAFMKMDPVPPAASEPTEDKYALLEQIHHLKEKGILTEEEFLSEKAKILQM
ncbi:SHOCT domain-containing protein [Alkalicoccus halolimnae]|uniref:SHOCT domain-containing protein n=1 Tax=Alkalicoccus halolimnae TaxID=1667239 RepID=A0A5C7F2T0_9BACI|nr:SHOCT domain-containing protein [Alkalicoccus halolimnae]TXF84613.1 hypothetical protein FTX54_10450 [Alkalicoccus halolimnae]